MEDTLRILVFASGGKKPDEGGSGFETMVWNTALNPPILDAEIIGVVSNNTMGGVHTKAFELKVPFKYFNGPFTAKEYQKILEQFDWPDFVMLSGWLKPFYGFPPSKTINIHPGPLPYTAGKYGHYVHEAVIEAYKKYELTQSAVTMHFVTPEYDKGPIIVEYPVHIDRHDTPETLAKRVNEIERVIQSYYLNLVVHGEIWVSEKGKVHYNSASIMPQFISQIS